MITPELVARINELAQKQRSTGLTEAEKTEQATLRRTYINSIKGQVKTNLDAAKEQTHTHSHKCGCGCGHSHHHRH